MAESVWVFHVNDGWHGGLEFVRADSIDEAKQCAERWPNSSLFGTLDEFCEDLDEWVDIKYHTDPDTGAEAKGWWY